MQSDDKKKWFPMRVTYGRELILKHKLKQTGITCYVPTRRDTVHKNGENIIEEVAIVKNLIFIFSSFNEISQLKTLSSFEPLRFITDHIHKDAPHNCMTIPTKQMEQFMEVVEKDNNEHLVEVLTMSDYLLLEGKRVRLKEGPFAGMEGKLKRIKGNKVVVFEIGVTAISIPLKNSHVFEIIN